MVMLLVLMVSLSSCKEMNTKSNAEENNAGGSVNSAGEYDDNENPEENVTREYFENVDKNYCFDDIVEEIGEPNHIEGSGEIYYVWDLADGTEAYVLFSSCDKIERIHIIDSDKPDELLYKREHN